MALPIFPAHLFRPSSVKASLRPMLISGGVSLSGSETVIQSDGGGRWEITMSGITLRTVEQLRLWEMWTSYMPGKSFLVPLVSVHTAPRPFAGGGLARPSSLYANDPAFPTEVRYAAPYIAANLVFYAPLRATTLTIDVKQGARLQGGEKFSTDGRGYVVERVVSRADFEPGDGQRGVCTISPPLRKEVINSAPLNFEWPTVRCRMAMGQDLAPDVSFGRRAEVSISFVEDFSDAD